MIAPPDRRPGSRARRLATLVALVVLGVAAVLATASPAAAHGGPGGVTVPASDYDTVVHGVDPPIPGIVVTALPGSGALRLENRSGSTVTVLGYNGEPYLRIGADGVFVNELSPATYLNEDLTGASTVPADARPGAEPRWRRVGDGPTATWHDHRAHWMQPFDPPEVTADPGASRVVLADWEVPILVADADAGTTGTTPTRAVVRGDVTYTPPGPTWPWLVLAIGLAVTLGTAALGRHWRAAMLVGSGLLIAATVADLAGMFGVAPGSPSVVGVALSAIVLAALLAGTVLVARDASSGLVVLGVAAAAAGALVGLTNRAALGAAHPASSLPPAAAQLVVAVALGAGVGVVGAVVVRQQRRLAELSAGSRRDR